MVTKVSSWARPKLDLGGCVLYLPLWRPSWDMTGTTVYDYISRQAGVVTGATWNLSGYPGRFFDALDDQIAIPDSAPIQNIWSGGGTVAAWHWWNTDGEGNGGLSLDKGVWHVRGINDDVSKIKIMLYQARATAAGEWLTTATEVPLGQWHLVFWEYDSDNVLNNPEFYVDGSDTALAITETSTPVGAATTDVGTGLLIGDNAASTRCLNAYLGDVLVFTKMLSVGERRRLYQATKWRYK